MMKFEDIPNFVNISLWIKESKKKTRHKHTPTHNIIKHRN